MRWDGMAWESKGQNVMGRDEMVISHGMFCLYCKYVLQCIHMYYTLVVYCKLLKEIWELAPN